MNEEWLCRTYVLKVASRCNLNCSYCYMYNKGDNSWRSQPKVMSDQTVVHLLERIKEHYGPGEGKRHVVLSFHGGEPLFASKEFFRFFIAKANEILPPAGIQPLFSIQTNATLIDEEWCEIFYDNNFDIGVSLDGKKEINDQYRVYHNGKGSYDDVMKGIEQIRAYKDLSDGMGFLIVVNHEADPHETYDFFKQFGSFDFLLPDYHHDEKSELVGEGKTTYAEWMIKVFDRWFHDPDRPRIRYFDGLVESILGGNYGVDTLGDVHNDLIVIETNGGYEAVDALKICGDGFTKAGANVATESIDEALQTDLANLYQRSHSMLAAKCEQCLIKQVCGGGYLPHRYSKAKGFNNPSVYCTDLMKLITHVQNSLLDAIPEEVLSLTDVRKITFEEAARHVSDIAHSPSHLDELIQFASPK